MWGHCLRVQALPLALPVFLFFSNPVERSHTSLHRIRVKEDDKGQTRPLVPGACSSSASAGLPAGRSGSQGLGVFRISPRKRLSIGHTATLGHVLGRALTRRPCEPGVPLRFYPPASHFFSLNSTFEDTK